MEEQFIRDNLEECYIRIIEDTMLLKPLCGLLKKRDIFNSNLYIEKDDQIRTLKGVINYQILKNEREKSKYESLLDMYKNGEGAVIEENIDDKSSLLGIKYTVEQYFKTSIDAKRLFRDLVYPRQIAMYYARKLTSYSYEKIGWIMGNKDHATVMHSCKVVINKSIYPDTARHLKELNEIFGIK